MPQWSFTGDPQTDQLILQNLQMQIGATANRSRARLSEHMAQRGLLGGGIEAQGIGDILAQQAGQEGEAALSAAQAQANRVREQQTQEQQLQNQLRAMAYQAELGRQRKMSRGQRAAMYGLTGAGAGSAAGPYGAAAGLVAGGLYGYFGPEG